MIQSLRPADRKRSTTETDTTVRLTFFDMSIGKLSQNDGMGISPLVCLLLAGWESPGQVKVSVNGFEFENRCKVDYGKLTGQFTKESSRPVIWTSCLLTFQLFAYNPIKIIGKGLPMFSVQRRWASGIYATGAKGVQEISGA